MVSRPNRRTFLKTGVAVGVATLAAPALAKAPINIRFSHIMQPSGHPKGEAAEMFKTLVAQRMGGDVVVEVFPNASLFNDEKVLEAMALGDVQMAAPALSKFETFTKAFQVFDLPFIFKDDAAVSQFEDSKTGLAMLASLKTQGLTGLAYWRNGMKQLSANKPLLMPADIKGLKIRIQPSEIIQAQFEVLGANPQKMAFPEVYGALQTGVVDGCENPWTNIYKQKFYEVQDGFTASNHGVIDYAVVADSAFWNGLPPDVRKELEAILVEVTAFERKRALELDLQSRDKLVSLGTTIRELNETQRAAWVAAVQPVWQRFSGQIGPDIVQAAAARS